MSITTTVTVFIGDHSGLTEFTSRTLGAQITQSAPIASFGRGDAIITFDNNDGAMTPGAGGTYSSIDWFAQAVFIRATVNSTTVEMFNGLVSSFNIRDDGVNSYVEIGAMDAMSTGGVGPNTWTIAGQQSASLGQYISRTFDGGFGATGYPMPRLGGAFSVCIEETIAISNQGVSLENYSFSGRAKDWINATAMPCGPAIAWPTTIRLDTASPGGLRTTYFMACLAGHLVRNATTRQDFDFAENATSGKLPFRNLRRRYTNDDMVNEVTITFPKANASWPDVTISEENTASTEKYGARAATFTEVIRSGSVGSPHLYAQAITERWANVFADSAFVVSNIEITASMVNAQVGSSSTSADLWADLLDISSGMGQIATVEFTPTGSGTAEIEVVMINARTIQITPSDLRLELGFLPGDQTGAFVLDSDVLGVLDQNRLG